MAEVKNLLGKLLFVRRNGEYEVLLGDVAELLDLLKENRKLIVISAADAESCVDEDIGYIVVTCADTAEEAVKRLIAADLVKISLDKPCTIVDIVSQKPFLLNADDVAVGSFNSLVDLLDETFCLARSFASCNQRNH